MSLFYSGPADGQNPGTVAELLDLLERQASDLLRAAGLPTTLEHWTSTHGLDALDIHSQEYRAVDVLLGCRNVRHAIGQQDAEAAAWAMAHLITNVENANLDTLEKPIRHGVKNLAKLEDARNERTRKVRAEDVPAIKAEIDGFCSRTNLSITAIRRKVGEKRGVDESRIRAVTQNYNPRRK